MITLRFDPKLEEAIRKTAENLGLKKSDLIRRSIIDYLDRQKSQTAWELGKDIFGKYASGRGDLSVDRKKILKEKIRSKRK